IVRGVPPWKPCPCMLSNHITLRIAEFSGLDFRTTRRTIPWPSVFVAVAIWVPLGWLTYHLVDIQHPWYATLSAVPAGIFFIATLGMLGEKAEVIPDDVDAENGDP